jgi:hypothetical protein
MSQLGESEISSYRGESLLSTINAHFLYRKCHEPQCEVYTEAALEVRGARVSVS